MTIFANKITDNWKITFTTRYLVFTELKRFVKLVRIVQFTNAEQYFSATNWSAFRGEGPESF